MAPAPRAPAGWHTAISREARTEQGPEASVDWSLVQNETLTPVSPGPGFVLAGPCWAPQHWRGAPGACASELVMKEHAAGGGGGVPCGPGGSGWLRVALCGLWALSRAVQWARWMQTARGCLELAARRREHGPLRTGAQGAATQPRRPGSRSRRVTGFGERVWGDLEVPAARRCGRVYLANPSACRPGDVHTRLVKLAREPTDFR